MNENELTELLVQSCESNQSKYVPWWNTDMKHSMYRYYVFSEEEINNITESVNQYSKETLLTLAGNLGFTLFHLLIWHGFYDAVKWALKQGINVKDRKSVV